MYLFNKLIGNKLVLAVTPPKQNICALKHFVGESAVRLLQVSCSDIEISVLFQKVGKSAVDSVGLNL